MVDQAEIRRLVWSRRVNDRLQGILLLEEAFPHLPDKSQAWRELYWLIHDKDSNVRWNAAKALGLAFAYIPDKTRAAQDICLLIHSKDIFARWAAVKALRLAFAYIPDKTQAWHDLLEQAHENDNDNYYSLGSTCDRLSGAGNFAQWNAKAMGLQHDVRWGAIEALGLAFAYIPDKTQACRDLDKLTIDRDADVRSLAFHSLGRASIFQATEAENDESFERYLSQAIAFFEKSSKESRFGSHLANFCLPFYTSFYCITFLGMEAQSEVNQCLIAAKGAIGKSKSREILFEAVECLSQALINVQKAKAATIQDRQLYLDALRRSCDRAGGLISKADDHTPGAAKTIERGLHIIKQNIRAELAEIEADSFRLLEATRHTPFESITNRAVEGIRGLSEIEYWFNAESIMDVVVPDIRTMCSFLLPRSKESVCKLENWEILGFEEKVPLFKKAITLCAAQMEYFSEQIGDKDDQIAFLRDEVLARLETINFHIFKMNIRSGDVAQSLRALEYELQKMKKIKDDLDRLGQRLENLGIHHQKALQELQESIPKLVKDLEEIAKKEDTLHDHKTPEVPDSLWHSIQNKVDALKDSPPVAFLSLVADLLQVISFLKPYIP